MSDEKKTCRTCGRSFPLSFFRSRQERSRLNALSHSAYKSSDCRGCENTARDAKKKIDRFRNKVLDTRQRHSQKLGIPVEKLRDEYAWGTDRMAHECEHAYGNGCSYCGEPYRDMPNGLAAITLDIRDRDKPPYYGLNTAWICATCNSSKSATDPVEWAEIRRCWERWTSEPRKDLPLLDWFR